MRIRNIAFALLACCFTAPSWATIIYESDASSVFTLVDAGGLGITYLVEDEPTSSSASGTASASIDEDLRDVGDPRVAATLETTTVFDVGTSIFLDSHLSGGAGAPFGSSSAEIFNSVFITLTNSGDDPLTATFEFSYSWLTSVLRTDPANESGFATAFFHLDGFAPSGSETLAIDEDPLDAFGPTPESDWLVNPFSALPPGTLDPEALSSGSETVLAFVTVPGMSTDSFQVITDAAGSATHVAEPASLLILGSGLALLVRRRRIYG